MKITILDAFFKKPKKKEVNQCSKCRIEIPKDVVVAGFDNIPIAEYVRPPLTTVQQDTAAAGDILVETLIRQIKGEMPKKPKLLKPKLIIRESSHAQ